jgi:hypothetical protein
MFAGLLIVSLPDTRHPMQNPSLKPQFNFNPNPEVGMALVSGAGFQPAVFGEHFEKISRSFSIATDRQDACPTTVGQCRLRSSGSTRNDFQDQWGWLFALRGNFKGGFDASGCGLGLRLVNRVNTT